MKIFLVDTLASLLFLTVVGALSEYFVAGMTWEQVVTSRLIAIPTILATGRIYGIWRDFIFRRFRTQTPTALTKGVIDTLAFVTFKIPVYMAILTLAGANLTQIFAAVSSALVLVVVLGRPFGIYLDTCRRLCGVTPA